MSSGKKLSSNTNEESLEDFLRHFAYETYSQKFRELIDQHFDLIVLIQPVGRKLFKIFCQQKSKILKPLLDLLLFAQNADFANDEQRKEFRQKIQILTETFKITSFEDSNFLQHCIRKMLELRVQKFDLKQVDFFIGELNAYFAFDVFNDFRKSIYFEKFLQLKYLEMNMANENGFEKFHLLSSGQFGSVYLCKSKLTKTKFACKYFTKSLLAIKNYNEAFLNEKIFLENVTSPFIVDLICTFETKTHVCMVTNYMAGGDLLNHLIKEDNFDMERVKFYAAELICGIVHLHAKDIVHFDLKPDNILIDHKGHLRICDLGLSRVIKTPQQFKFTIGTFNYIAPEILQNEPVTAAVDWFSFGCILYEMIEGYDPFEYLYKLGTRFNAKHLIININAVYSLKFSNCAENICRGLLAKDPKLRMENCVGDRMANKLKKHPFFESIDWPVLETGQMKPPFVPKVNENYHDRYRSTLNFEPLDHWVPSEDDLQDYKEFCTGADPVNWQLDVIKSGLLKQIYDKI